MTQIYGLKLKPSHPVTGLLLLGEKLGPASAPGTQSTSASLPFELGFDGVYSGVDLADIITSSRPEALRGQLVNAEISVAADAAAVAATLSWERCLSSSSFSSILLPLLGPGPPALHRHVVVESVVRLVRGPAVPRVDRRAVDGPGQRGGEMTLARQALGAEPRKQLRAVGPQGWGMGPKPMCPSSRMMFLLVQCMPSFMSRGTLSHLIIISAHHPSLVSLEALSSEEVSFSSGVNKSRIE